MMKVSPSGFDSLHRVESEILFEEGRRKHYLDMVLQHDNRTEVTDVQLLLKISNREGDNIHQDTLKVKLASSPGIWVRTGIINHDIDISLKNPIYIAYPGLYNLSIYALEPKHIQGINLIGFCIRE